MNKLLSLVIITVLCPVLTPSIRTNRFLNKNVTDTLDLLLAPNHYDKRLRPGLGGPPVKVAVNLLIRSMGPVSDDDQSFGLDCYFRQYWYDTRLRFKEIPGIDEFSLPWLFLDKVWKPDTYFVNGKRSYLHRITAPNKFLRLRPDGLVMYSTRLTITASCPMYLRKFPLDAQKCPLILGSYGYPIKDVIYNWTVEDAVRIQPDLELAQFDLVNVTYQMEKLLERGGQKYSTLQADFWLKRHTGYFMLQVYVPCGLIVLCSWVSFWIDPGDVPARAGLGATTVLSLTTLGFGGRAQLPKVSYWTALDWFVIICFTSVFSVVIEYACVNFIDKLTKDLKALVIQKKQQQTTLTDQVSEEPPLEPIIRKCSVFESPQAPPALKQRSLSVFDLPRRLSTTLRDFFQPEPHFDIEVPTVIVSNADGSLNGSLGAKEEIHIEVPNKPSWNTQLWLGLLHMWQKWHLLPQEDEVARSLDEKQPDNKFSKIDIGARKGFPIAFAISLTLYLIAFAYYLTDEFPARG